MKIAFTGHRPNKLGNDYDLKSLLIARIKHKIIDHLNELHDTLPIFITGMALGIDTLAAKIAIESKIPFIAAIPFIGQDSKWLNKSQEEYCNLLSQAQSIYLVDAGEYLTYQQYLLKRSEYQGLGKIHLQYSPAKMQKRNEWMVDQCDILIAVWDGTSGGTANCVKYAEEKKQIIRINPYLILS